ncbi:MAG TPA: protein-glutamate O-methyltransferase CheR [Methylibium sp.]|nr:protein-glutamate O-methyltransferase CheR [Methylibium sp.]
MPELVDMDGATLQQAMALVHRYTGVTIAEGKKTMLQARLRTRMRRLQLASYADYLDRLDEDTAERSHFIDVVTTHQTSFFRTPRIWHYLREHFLPAWADAHPGQTLRAWSAAASTGEEACSLAISCEEFRRTRPGFEYEIFGSDISEEVLRQARAGVYEGTSVAPFRQTLPVLFERYNESGSPERFALPAALRRRMRFETGNLMQAPPRQPPFDLVLLRNVLIYFTPEDLAGIVRRVAGVLRPGGQLIIGESESLSGQDLPFDFIQPQVYRLARP